MMHHRSTLAALAVLTTVAVAHAPTARAQTLIGYGPAAAEAEREVESKVAGLGSPARAESLSRVLSREPHMAGTPAEAHTRDFFAQVLRDAGVTPEIQTYTIYMPHPTIVQLFRTDGPLALELPLQEGPIAEDTTSTALPQVPVFNGYSAPGDTTGDVVYVNYGLVEDYRTLDSLGISVKGKIVVARYGRSYRGIKAREAEKHGAAALIIYSDPADDGYTRGDVYPEGPMRPEQGLQRGSVYNDNGDPTTPGYASLPGAPRVPLAQTSLPRIPVIPTSYKNATVLLKDVRGGGDLPKGWQGALPFHYHIGPGPVRARVVVNTDAATKPYKDIWNVFGIIQGSEFPDEMIFIGGHRDAWGPGAADNVSGTVSVLEAARIISTLVKQGYRPKRTLVFASWDAEEWGLMGSTEYVESDTARLSRYGVAYFNQDMVAFGPSLGGSGSPSLRGLFREITKLVRTPNDTTTVYQAWRRDAKLTSDTLEPEMDDPGGGSDFAGFYNHLGVPIIEWGFGGPQGIYHSAYDSYHWLTKFGDPTFKYHVATAQIGALMLLRMANADILPYDYVAYAKAMRALADTVSKTIAARGWNVSTVQLTDAIDRMHGAAATFNGVRDSVLAEGEPSTETRAQTNEMLLRVERAFVRPQGLRNRPWYRNLIYASDDDNGYANIGFPSITEAVRAGDQALTAREIADLSSRFNAAAKILVDAAQSLR